MKSNSSLSFQIHVYVDVYGVYVESCYLYFRNFWKKKPLGSMSAISVYIKVETNFEVRESDFTF